MYWGKALDAPLKQGYSQYDEVPVGAALYLAFNLSAVIPVQVGNRIVATVDPSRAEAMARGSNVRVIRKRSTGQIVRLLVEACVLYDESNDGQPVFHQDSRTSTQRERLFSGIDSISRGAMGAPSVYAHKPSSLFSASLMGRGGGRARRP